MDPNSARMSLTNLVVSPEMQSSLDESLGGLIREHGALWALLVERSGLLLAWAGDSPVDNTQVAALAAGIFKSLGTLADLLQEVPLRQFRQCGAKRSTVMSLLDGYDILVTRFPAQFTDSAIEVGLGPLRDCLSGLMTTARTASPPVELAFDSKGLDDMLGNVFGGL